VHPCKFGPLLFVLAEKFSFVETNQLLIIKSYAGGVGFELRTWWRNLPQIPFFCNSGLNCLQRFFPKILAIS
jgi:hypothetical protein